MTIEKAQETAVRRGLTALFRQGYASSMPFYPKVCTVRPSTGKDEEYAIAGSMPGVREWVGERQYGELSAARWTIAAKLWETGIEVEKTDLEDDRIGMYSTAAQEMGQELAYHPDDLRTEMMCDGNATLCWDGQYFYDTDHSWKDSGTQSNSMTYNATDHTNVTSAEFKAAINAAVERLLSFKKDNGKPWVRPIVGRLSDLVVEVPLALREPAITAYEQQLALEPSATAPTSNVIIDRPQVVCNVMAGAAGHGSDSVCYLHWLGSNLKPFVFQPRWSSPKTSMVGMMDDTQKAAKFLGTNRMNFGYFMWMHSIRIEFN